MMYAVWDNGGEYVLYVEAETRGKARSEATRELGIPFADKLYIRKAVPCECGRWSVNGQCWDCYEKEQAELERRDMEQRQRRDDDATGEEGAAG